MYYVLQKCHCVTHVSLEQQDWWDLYLYAESFIKVEHNKNNKMIISNSMISNKKSVS